MMGTLTDPKDVELFVHRTRRDTILRHAAAKQLPAVLTRSGAHGWQSLRTRFIACRGEEGRIVIEQPDGESGDERPVLDPGERIGVSFRRGRAKCLFNTTVVGPLPAPTGPVLSPAAVALHWPDELQELQRRFYQRIEPPHNCSYKVSIAAAEFGTESVTGSLADLSAGGCGVSSTESVGLKVGDLTRLGFSFPPRSGRLVVTARVRYLECGGGGESRIGFQFLGLDTSVEKQRNLALLASVVSEFRRAQLLKDRRNLPSGMQRR